MKALTVRNLPKDVAVAVQRRAREHKSSLNKAVIELLEEGAGLTKERRKRPLHHDLDALAGTWSEEDAQAFEKALREQRAIDEELWK